VIEAYPIAVVNVAAASIHLWHLRRLVRRKDEVFRVLPVEPGTPYLMDFLDFYRPDIEATSGPAAVDEQDGQVVAFILRDMVPAGLFVGRMGDDDTFGVSLDYVIPQYRDFRVGEFVYSQDSTLLGDLAPRCVQATAATNNHRRYLRRMGFREVDGEGRFEFALPSASTSN